MSDEPMCIHADKVTKDSYVSYGLYEKQVILKVQTWYCSACNTHGAQSEIYEEIPKIHRVC